MLNRILCAIACCATAFAANASDVERATLDVKGMDCAACPLTVKAVLKQQPGVMQVKVDAERRTAEVSFDPATVTPDKLARVVTETGYPATARK